MSTESGDSVICSLTSQQMKTNMATIKSEAQRLLGWAGVVLRSGRRFAVDTCAYHEQKKQSAFLQLVGPFEAYVVSVQSLLIWERPYLSAVALIAVNCLFWLVVSCSSRFYSFAAIVAALAFMYKTWVNSIWPEIRVPPEEGDDTEQWTPVNPQVLSVPELNRYFTDWTESARKWIISVVSLRKTHPGLFCLLACTMFALTAILGRMVSGVLILYTMLMTVTLGPGIALYVVPESWYEQFEAILNIASGKPPKKALIGGDGSSGDAREVTPDEVEEFLPKVNETELMRQLSLSYDNESKSGTDSSTELALTQDFGPLASLEEEVQGLGSFPDPEEESDLDSFLPDLTLGPTPEEPKSAEGMHFVTSHFQDISSDSDSEDAFLEGLSFGRPQPKTVEASKSRPLAVGPSKGSASAQTKGSRHPSQGSDIDINEYEVVDESDVSS